MPDNNRIAYLFPGQGSQEVGMGKRLYEMYPEAQRIFDSASEVLGFSLASLCFNGPEEELTQTINVQPAILTTCVACLNVAREIAGAKMPLPAYVAGHSVGEYAALVANGMMGFKDAVLLVRERGRLMQQASQDNPGVMMALMGADEKTAAEICSDADMDISNINGPGQIVISGSKDNASKAKSSAESRGIRRIIPLKVNGAFHSRLMSTAAKGLKPIIESTRLHSSGIPLVSNVTGNFIYDAISLPEELSTQVIKCVQWQRSVEAMVQNGVGIFIEFGHGQVVANLIKRIDPEVKVYNIGDIETENQTSVIIS